MPPVGSQIITNKGRAQVLAQEILAGQLLVQMEDMRRIVIDAGDVMTVLSRSGGRSKPKNQSGSRPQPQEEGGGVAQAELPADEAPEVDLGE